MRRPNGRCNTQGSGWRRKHFLHLPTLRQEQDFSGLRPGPQFGISRLPETDSKTTRRIGRANAGFSRKVSGISDSQNCVVADAVRYEPVSTPNSLLTGKRTGNLPESSRCASNLKSTTRANSMVWWEIPYTKNRELFRRNSEFWFRNREFSRSNPKSSLHGWTGTLAGLDESRERRAGTCANHVS
jgi:hypothetical protein